MMSSCMGGDLWKCQEWKCCTFEAESLLIARGRERFIAECIWSKCHEKCPDNWSGVTSDLICEFEYESVHEMLAMCVAC